MLYWGFGLRIESALALPLPEARGDGAADVSIREVGHTTWSSCEEGWLDVDAEEMAAKVSSDGREVVFVLLSPLSLEERQSFLLGMVMLQVLSVRGLVCLHGSVVRLGDAAVGFVGPSGSGKSTLCMTLMQRGHALLCDDILPLRFVEGEVWVQPTFPLIRLWDGVLARFSLDAARFPRALGYREKRVLQGQEVASSFASEPMPLRQLYLFPRGQEESQASGVLEAGALQVELMHHVLKPHVVDKSVRSLQFRLTAALSRQVQGRVLRPIDGPQEANALAEPILATLAQASSGRVPDAM